MLTVNRAACSTLSVATVLILFALLGALTACGGGDPEDDERRDTQPVDCPIVRAELCKV